MTAAIETVDLCKRFGRVHALLDLQMRVPEGSMYALLGPNGAGKSTAVKVMLNLLPSTSGLAQVLGVESSKLRGPDFCGIGYVSEGQDLPQWMKVGQLFDYLRPFYPSWDRELEKDLLDAFELPWERKIRALSLGMRMKLRLATAVAFHPKLLVLDEPFSALDPLTRDELIERLLDCAAETTILICSHDLDEIESFSSHVGYIDHGRLLFEEEMTALTARFREVTVALDAAASPSRWPDGWLLPEISGAAAQFIESHYDEERTAAEIHRLFGGVRNVAATPMTLRSIVSALAKSNRRKLV